MLREKKNRREFMTLALARVKTNSTVQADDILYKRMKDGSFCKGIILPSRPLLLTYSKSQEQIKVTMCYEFWNASGVPQHIL